MINIKIIENWFYILLKQVYNIWSVYKPMGNVLLDDYKKDDPM